MTPADGSRLRLRGLLVNRVDLVKAGDNPGAAIALYKRQPSQEAPTMTPLDHLSALKDLTKEDADALAKALADASPLVGLTPDDLTKGLESAAVAKGAGVPDHLKALPDLLVPDTFTKVEEYVKALEGEVAKARAGDDPYAGLDAVTKARLTERDERIAALEAKDRAGQFAVMAKSLGSLHGAVPDTVVRKGEEDTPVTGEDALTALLDTMEKAVGPEVFTKAVLPLLTAADERIAKSALFGQAGGLGTPAGDDLAKLQTIAKAKRDADPNLSESDALVAAANDNPDLAKAYQDTLTGQASA